MSYDSRLEPPAEADCCEREECVEPDEEGFIDCKCDNHECSSCGGQCYCRCDAINDALSGN